MFFTLRMQENTLNSITQISLVDEMNRKMEKNFYFPNVLE